MRPQADKRYVVEQSVLPNRLYTSGPFLLNQLLKGVGAAMEEIYLEAGAERPVPGCFSESYRVFCRANISVQVLRIGMPEPKNEWQSRAVYLCYCSKNGADLYFTSELSESGKYMLCCRPDSEKFMHMLCCEAPDDIDSEFELVADRYWELVIDDGIK